jgi:hypothetical protein
MMNRQATVAAAVLIVMSIAPFMSVASAMPIADPLVIKNAAPTNIETVQWRGRGWRGRGPGWGFGGALLGGAIIGGILAAPYYYGPGPYYGPGYVAPVPGDAVGYCMQRFRSYDPGSGTYLGFDGLRHPCP